MVVALIHAWKWMGLSMLIYLAGLKTIPRGPARGRPHRRRVAPWRTFWRIRFPLLAPAVTFNVATALLGSMNGFDIVQATTGGGPARTTEILNIFIYRTFGQGLFAQATTMSLVLFLWSALLAFPVICDCCGDGRRSCERTAAPRRRASASRVRRVVAALLRRRAVGIPLWLVVVTAGKSQAEALDPDLSLPSALAALAEPRGRSGPRARCRPRSSAACSSWCRRSPACCSSARWPPGCWPAGRRGSSRSLYALAISGIVLPPAVVTVVLLLRQLGLAGTPVGMIGVYMGIYLSTVDLLRHRLRPHHPGRAGGGRPDRRRRRRCAVFAAIMLPLLRPVLATATILICLYVWNDVFYAFFVVGGRLDTLPLNLFQVASAGLYLNNWHLDLRVRHPDEPAAGRRLRRRPAKDHPGSPAARSSRAWTTCPAFTKE